jgi:hypothetical protein
MVAEWNSWYTNLRRYRPLFEAAMLPSRNGLINSFKLTKSPALYFIEVSGESCDRIIWRRLIASFRRPMMPEIVGSADFMPCPANGKMPPVPP